MLNVIGMILSNWPIGIAILIAVILVSIFGGFGFKGGLTSVRIGGFSRKRKRSCGDCVLMMMGKREISDNKRDFIQRNILKDQMNFVEQKLIQVQTDLLSSYRQALKTHRTIEDDPAEETKQYRLYQGLLSNSLCTVKDEIRRSFKENGFEELSGSEFSNYVKNKAQALYAMASTHIGDQYPYEKMIVSWEIRQQDISTNYIHKIEDACFEVFQHAKDIKRYARIQLDKINDDLVGEINDFVQRNEDN